MGMKTGVQRLAAVIGWLSFLWIALGVYTLIINGGRDPLPQIIFFFVPGAGGLLLAYILGGFGKGEG